MQGAEKGSSSTAQKTSHSAFPYQLQQQQCTTFNLLFLHYCTNVATINMLIFQAMKLLHRNSIANSTFLQIQKLKLALETVKREYKNLIATRRCYISLLNNVNKDNKVSLFLFSLVLVWNFELLVSLTGS